MNVPLARSSGLEANVRSEAKSDVLPIGSRSKCWMKPARSKSPSSTCAILSACSGSSDSFSTSATRRGYVSLFLGAPEEMVAALLWRSRPKNCENISMPLSSRSFLIFSLCVSSEEPSLRVESRMCSWVVSKLASPLCDPLDDTGEPAVGESEDECRARREMPAPVALELAEL